MDSFRGCKLALIHAGAVLVYTRDDKPGILFPDMLDLPGGGREGDESPEQCVLRELHEEFGIVLPRDRLEYARRYEIPHMPGFGWFFAGRLRAAEVAGIRFGNEGVHWQLMAIEEFLAHPRGVPHLKSRLRDYLAVVEAGADERELPGR